MVYPCGPSKVNIKLPDESLDSKKRAINGSLMSLLETIVTLPWIDSDSAGVFSADPKTHRLTLVASLNLPSFIENSCAFVNYGECQCGKAAVSETLIHTSCMNKLHLTRFDGMKKYGNYALPISYQSDLLGVLVVYVKEGHQYSKKEAEVITSFAKTISYLLLSRKILQEKQLSDLVLAHSKQGIMLTDNSLEIIWVNEMFETITGYKCKEIVGEKPSLLSSGKHGADFYKDMWEEIKRNDSWEGEVWNRRKNGEIYLELLNIIALKNNDGEVLNYGAIFKDLSLIKSAEEKIHKLAYYDSLTGFANREYFLQYLDESIKTSRRRNECLTLLYIDLDGFKNINDTLGHHIGDQLLVKIGKRLKHMLRETDFIARLGGDEFCILVSNVYDESNAALVAENCLKQINKTMCIEERVIKLEASIGIAYFPNDAETAGEYLKAADTAMYESKIRGKNRFTFYDKAMTLELEKRLTFEHLLKKALKNEQFELYYQPKIDLKSGKISGVEALIRWNHPKKGLMTPIHFVPVLEKLGIIDKVGLWVMQTACKQLRHWNTHGLPDLQMAVNISPTHFGQPGFVKSVENIIRKTEINPEYLEIEITESMAGNLNLLAQTCLKLKKLGVKIAIDDFGTGYSSLSILGKLNIHTLKIDKLFIDDLPSDNRMALMLGGIQSLAKGLGYGTVVEGVETEEQAKLLYGLGFKTVQGYYFSRPVPVLDIPLLIHTNFTQRYKSD